MWRIEIPGVPVAQPRAGHHHLRRRDGSLLTRPDGDPIIKTYQPTPIAEWKARAAWAMRQGRGAEPPLVGPVSLIVRAVFPCPPSQHRERVPRPARWHTHRPDLDNIVKAVKDAAKGVLWLDDSQVCVLEASKLIAPQLKPPPPGVYLEVDEIVGGGLAAIEWRFLGGPFAGAFAP